MPQTLAHISDLHIGQSDAQLQAVIALHSCIQALKVDHILVTGDITDNGRISEYQAFKAIFADEIKAGIVTVLPGNHDRHGDEVSKEMMNNERLITTHYPGLLLLTVDTSGPHNRYRFLSHGKINHRLIRQIEQALKQAKPGELVILGLHHHIIAQPEEYKLEKIASWFGSLTARELQLGPELIKKIGGHCDLILHGHRHIPLETTLPYPKRELRIYNAGTSPALKKFRLFTFDGGKLIKKPEWIDCSNSATV